MLDIVPSCSLVQYQGNIMMQPRENGKNSNFRPNLEPPKFFSWVLLLLTVKQCSKLSSYAISSKTNKQNLKNDKNLILGHIRAKFAPPPPPHFFAILPLLVTDIVPSYHSMQFKEKLMNQTWENNKKPNFGPDFGLFDPHWSPKNFFWQVHLD